MANGVTGLGATLRGLRGDLHGAEDRQLTQVVAMLDRLADRGEADALIAGLRPRLARLRPTRPQNFHRILFTPFDPLIVPIGDWLPDSPGVPRTILRPLGDLVRQAAPARISAIDTAFAAPDAQPPEIGRTIWALAAETLPMIVRPPGWQQASGLRDADFSPLCHSLAIILHQAAALHDMIAAETAGQEADAASVEQMLAPLAVCDNRTASMLIALLNARLPNARVVRTLSQMLTTDTGNPALQQAANRAHEFILCGLETAVPPAANFDQAPSEMERLARALDTQATRLRNRPALLGRVTQARSRLDAACRANFAELLTAQFLPSLGQMGDADEAEIDRFEHDARALRRFDLAARGLGGAPSYDQALRASAEKLRPMPHDSAATRIDKLRLAEILVGSAAAAQFN